jgi:hypothetical protein
MSLTRTDKEGCLFFPDVQMSEREIYYFHLVVRLNTCDTFSLQRVFKAWCLAQRGIFIITFINKMIAIYTFILMNSLEFKYLCHYDYKNGKKRQR